MKSVSPLLARTARLSTLAAVALAGLIVAAVLAFRSRCVPNVGAPCASDRECAQCADVLTGDFETKTRTAMAVKCRHATCELPSFDPCVAIRAEFPPVNCTPNVGVHCGSDQDCAQCADVLNFTGACNVRIPTAVACVDGVCQKTGCPQEPCPRGQVCWGCVANIECFCSEPTPPLDASPTPDGAPARRP
jgi:hypothetical protein